MIRLLLAVAAALFLAASSWADDVDVDELITQVAQGSFGEQIEAASELATSNDERIPELIQARLAAETDFHARLALHFLLASHGERESVQHLIDALQNDGHYGARYLRWLADEEFEWNTELCQAWLDSMTEEEYRRFIAGRWRRQAAMEEWHEFARLDALRLFGEEFTEEDARRLEELPTTKAWRLYEEGISALQTDGDRPAAARLFRQITDDYPETYYYDQSKELADLLSVMVAEDEAFDEPPEPSALEQTAQINLYIYHLRNVVAYQLSNPGHCSVLSDFVPQEQKKAATALRDIGPPAIPDLIELLDDRRPIRGVGYFRFVHPDYTVLRYQDAALQILEAITEQDLYEPTVNNSYLSDESDFTREIMISRIKDRLEAIPGD